MKKHKCSECDFMLTFVDSGERRISICVFDQSDCYLSEVGCCMEDCELDGFAEELWCHKHGVEFDESAYEEEEQ